MRCEYLWRLCYKQQHTHELIETPVLLVDVATGCKDVTPGVCTTVPPVKLLDDSLELPGVCVFLASALVDAALELILEIAALRVTCELLPCCDAVSLGAAAVIADDTSEDESVCASLPNNIDEAPLDVDTGVTEDVPFGDD